MPFFSFRRCSVLPWLLAALFAFAPGAAMTSDVRDTQAAARREMLTEIRRMTHDTRTETGRAQIAARVMSAIEDVPRHHFVSPAQERQAYENRPLGIGQGQTISQPFIVALMTDLLEVQSGHNVLEIGTGSGYQAAVLSRLAATVYTVEVVEPLAREAAEKLARLGYRNVRARLGDGQLGWPEAAPFDGIMVTAAAREVPPALIEQLRAGGRLVIPVGEQHGVQTLYVIEKKADGTTSRRAVLGVRFVPLTGGRR